MYCSLGGCRISLLLDFDFRSFSFARRIVDIRHPFGVPSDRHIRSIHPFKCQRGRDRCDIVWSDLCATFSFRLDQRASIDIRGRTPSCFCFESCEFHSLYGDVRRQKRAKMSACTKKKKQNLKPSENRFVFISVSCSAPLGMTTSQHTHTHTTKIIFERRKSIEFSVSDSSRDKNWNCEIKCLPNEWNMELKGIGEMATCMRAMWFSILQSENGNSFFFRHFNSSKNKVNC